jgi:multicomponent Na+:H+ antiporter subunit G
MSLAIDIASGIFIAVGCFFIVAGAIGLLRLPDIYTRVHGASLIDTAGAGFLLCGLMLQAGAGLVTLKLIFVLAVFFFTLPVAAHALAQAALHEGVKPLLSEDRTSDGLKDQSESGRRP